MNDGNADAGRLHKIAETVMTAAAAQPAPWHAEWEAWFVGLMGPCPLKAVGSRAFENWMLAAMGSYISWGYFAEQLADKVEEAEVVEAAEERPPSLELHDMRKDGLLIPKQVKQFAVLGPDGQPVVEGKR